MTCKQKEDVAEGEAPPLHAYIHLFYTIIVARDVRFYFHYVCEASLRRSFTRCCRRVCHQVGRKQGAGQDSQKVARMLKTDMDRIGSRTGGPGGGAN